MHKGNVKMLFSSQESAAVNYKTCDVSGEDVFVFPMSFAQQRLWFLDQLEPGNSVYNIPAAMCLRGALNGAALEQSLNEIVRRHEALRTTFSVMEGQPVQVIAPGLALTLPVVDLGNLLETEREAEAQRLTIEEAQRPFDLAQGPLLRTTLLRLDKEEHILLLTMHHIVSDGWSMGVLFRELSALYEAFSAGKPSPLPELPIQYADFAVWQRQWLQGETLEAQLAYWKKQLDGVCPVLELPTDRPRPAVQTFRGARQSMVLSKSLTEAVKALSHQEGTTLFMTLLAAFQTLLYRYTGQDDIIVGSPIANRNRSEIEGLIGFFVNTLVLRTDLSDNPTFRELLGRVREVALGAYAHQDLPFEKLVEALHPERDLSRNPMFQVMFILQNTPMATLELGGLTLNQLNVDWGIAMFDLTLSMRATEQGLMGFLEYNTDLFNAATISRMLDHFQTLLEGIVANPDQPIATLRLLTEAEWYQLLVEWNDTKVDYLEDLCIHQLFEAQVERTSDATVVIFGDKQLTYRELNTKANQLAHYLRKCGVGPEVLVGIYVERSPEMVIGVLGILKAGGAYVPLDPSYPKERLVFMLEDTCVAVLLTQERLLEVLPEHGTEVVCLDSDWEAITQESEENPINGASAENLAYVLYTSGSTGKPKGVAMSHRSLCNLIWWQLSSKLPSGAKTLQFASLSFDVSFQEIFSTWCSGGTLVLISEELRRDAVGLLGYLTDKSVERLFLPFIALQQLAEVADGQGPIPTSLREIITAGEQLQITRPIVSLFSKLTDCTLHNQYGPTESHVVTAFTLTGSPSGWPALPPIGRPIANTQIYLLDRNLQPVPVGVSGELYIGGDSLARGYLNRPELTAEKFISNPFSDEAGTHLYKTGDLARYLPDGNIEFLGRLDHQVKIRGFRIELGEIEAVLSQHLAVQETVVIVREDTPSDKRLVAYLVIKQEPFPTINELRSFLKEKLPDYMVPSAFMFLDALPLTPNGKVDRQALPAPDRVRPELESTFVAPRTPVEEVLAGIWAKVLGLEQVGIHDNFFELGGHSLLATQVISRLRDAFQVELPLRSLFEVPTVADLAERVETVRWAVQGLQASPRATMGDREEGEL